MISLRSSDALGVRERHLWKLVRRLFPRKWRWFFEGHPEIPGQLWLAERRLLYETVRAYRPLHCFEISTWKGGGSTLFIAQALYENGEGRLHTVEMDESLFRLATVNYQIRLQHLDPHVEFHLGHYRERLGEVLASVGCVDLLFLDGPESPDETMKQYLFFLPFMKQGTLLLAHDWFTDKAMLVKPLVERGDKWEILELLRPPRSVGLALAVKL